jgi:hypothetical protein
MLNLLNPGGEVAVIFDDGSSGSGVDSFLDPAKGQVGGEIPIFRGEP